VSVNELIPRRTDTPTCMSTTDVQRGIT